MSVPLAEGDILVDAMPENFQDVIPGTRTVEERATSVEHTNLATIVYVVTTDDGFDWWVPYLNGKATGMLFATVEDASDSLVQEVFYNAF